MDWQHDVMMVPDKTRFRFRKEGDFRLVSHHDLMRTFERMLRRSELPFRSTEGFHPQPRLVFALSLPLGIVGLAEIVEIEWTDLVDPDEAMARLRAVSPNGLTFSTAKRVEIRQSAQPLLVEYRIPLSLPQHARIEDHCAAVLDANELWVIRERPRARNVNLRPYLKGFRCHDGCLEMSVWITPDGSARADEVLRLLGLSTLLDDGIVIERNKLEVVDEADPQLFRLRPLSHGKERQERTERPLVVNQPATSPSAAHWGASPNGPIVE